MIPRGQSARRAFTLIEVTLGLAILVLIFGVIFQMVQMSVLGADAAGQNSRRSREITGLFALVRQLCLDLSVRSQVTLVPRASGRGYDLVLSSAPMAILPERQGGANSLRFSLQKDPAGGSQSLVLQEIFVQTNALGLSAEGETNSFVLMRDVVSLEWLAGTPLDRESEQTQWTDAIKPAYLKLVLARREGDRIWTNTGIFWIPTGYGPSGQPPVDPLTRGPLAVTNTNAAP